MCTRTRNPKPRMDKLREFKIPNSQQSYYFDEQELKSLAL